MTSLDEQYLDFVTRTRHIFEQHPRLEAMRYNTFKHLLVGHETMGATDVVKHWVRPLLKREHTAGPLEPADVIVWIESRRATSIAALLDAYKEMKARGISVTAISLGGPQKLLGEALQFQYVAQVNPPRWAKGAWQSLVAAYDELRDPGLERTFMYNCATQRGLYAELERLFAAMQPKVVFIFSKQMPGGAAVAVVAREQGALSLELQHGVLQPFYVPLVTDYMLTWGQSSNDTLTALGVPEERLVPLGSPRHDDMHPVGDGEARATFLSALKLPDLPTLVFFSNGNDLVRNGIAPAESAQWLEATAAQLADRFNFVVRLHPNEDGALYADCPHLTITRQELDLATTLEGCDIVGSLCSTVLVEGLLYDKPVWQFFADGWPNLADNWKTGLATRIASESELVSMVENVITQGTDNLFEARLKERVFANHGHATHAIADFVQQHLEDTA
ncbi:MAG: hypothetical protein GYB65_11205 [Chloroflexi bacterium]|nr:hypothetical protein [Chloroflexota bacterium]